MLMRRRGGFALIEMIVVVGLISLLTYIGYPYYKVFMRNAAYRSAARELASAMQTVRAEAITKNSEQSMVIAPDKDRYWFSIGGRERPDANEDKGWIKPDHWALVDLRVAEDPSDVKDCEGDDKDDEVTLRFYPNGTVNRAVSICILNTNKNPDHKFTTRLLFPTTGQVEIVRPQP